MPEERRLTSRDVPNVLDALCGGDQDAQHEALFRMCPCRNRRYDKEVWLEIFRICEESPDGVIRDRARHAIDTLRQRVRTDPRSQELVQWLADQGTLTFTLEGEIPEWRPRVQGLKIPRPERARRSRVNRRR